MPVPSIFYSKFAHIPPGVTWDPVGVYLATASDDKSVIIWRTNDWQEGAFDCIIFVLFPHALL